MFSENFKLIAAQGAVPGHGNLGGDIRKVSVWANIVVSIEHNCLHQLSKRRQQKIMQKLCTHVVFMHFTYHRRIQVPKKWRHCWPPTFSTLAPPMDNKYYCNRFITFHCHSSRKSGIHLASIVQLQAAIYFAFLHPHIQWPISAYDFWIFQSDKHMWITCPFPVDCPLLDQNRFTNVPVMRDQKNAWNSWFLPPLYPLLRIFENFFF